MTVHLLTTVSMSDRKHSEFQRVSGINKFSHWVDHRYLEFCFIEQGSANCYLLHLEKKDTKSNLMGQFKQEP